MEIFKPAAVNNPILAKTGFTTVDMDMVLSLFEQNNWLEMARQGLV